MPDAATVARLWRIAQSRLPVRVLVRTHGAAAACRLRLVLGALPIAPDGAAWCLVERRYARPADEQLIIAARAGWPCHPAAAPGVELGDAVHGLPTAAGWVRFRAHCALRGPELVDLVAYAPGWPSGPLVRLRGHAVALGDANDRLCDAADPVPIARDLAGWLRGVDAGAVLPLGDDAERRTYLRGLAGGLVAEDARHARELRRLVVPDPAPPPPQIWLTSSSAEAAA